MSSSGPHLPTLIAHYLLTAYPSVLPTFLAAASLPPPDPANPPNPDLRTLAADYASHSLTSELASASLEERVEPARDGTWRNWTAKDVVAIPLERGVGLKQVVRTVEGVSAMNLLTVDVRRVPRREFDTGLASYRSQWNRSIITSSVDKTLKILDYTTGEVDRIIEPHRAAVLSFALHPTMGRYLLTSSMDGTTVLTDLISSTSLQTFKSNKFVVRVKTSSDGRWMATASYDHHIVIYEANELRPVFTEDDQLVLDETDDISLACEPTLRYTERYRIHVSSNPEAVVFHPSGEWVMYTLRDSHLLHYIRLPRDDGMAMDGDGVEDWESQTKSFNPHPMDTHVSFSVLDLAIHPSGKVIACLTGDHRGGSGERVLLYGIDPEETDRLACLWTGGEGDDFVLPRMSWLPDGTGIIVTTSNGYLNLVSLSGEVRSSLKVHGLPNPTLGQASSEVVRDVCVVPSEDGRWETVSVGYDRMIRISQ